MKADMCAYNIACYWKNREEDLDACANRAAEFLKRMAACDPVFARVYVSSRKHESRLPVSADSELLKPLLEDKIAEKWGSRISFVSDHQDCDEQWTIHIRCGAAPAQAPKGWSNFCMPLLPKRGRPLETLLQPSVLSCIIRAMVQAWEPDWAVIYDDRTLDELYERAGIPGDSRKEMFLGWMTYFGKHMGAVPKNLPAYSRLDLGGGTLLILTPEPPQSDQPEQARVFQEVLLGLQGVGLLPG
ncbi:MAG: Imm52 family immunity protein [Candidatus Angelobacter sp.]